MNKYVSHSKVRGDAYYHYITRNIRHKVKTKVRHSLLPLVRYMIQNEVIVPQKISGISEKLNCNTTLILVLNEKIDYLLF